MGNTKIAMECGRKAVVAGTYKKEENQNLVLKKVLSVVLKTIEFSDTLPQIVSRVNDAFEEVGTGVFVNQFTLDSCKNTMAQNLWRWVKYESSSKNRIVARDLSIPIRVNGQTEKIKADLLIDRGNGFFYLCQFHNGKPKLTYGSGMDSARKAVEVYFLDKAARLLKRKSKLHSVVKGAPAPGSNQVEPKVIPAIYYLKASGDKKGIRNSTFEQNRGENVIATMLSKAEKDSIRSRIKALNISVNETSQKCGGCMYEDLCKLDFVPRTKLVKTAVPTGSRFSTIKLSAEQEALVKARDNMTQVNAVAGSGKTTVIGIKALSLLEEMSDDESLDEKKILMITFTEKAAKEMREKLEGYNKAFYGTGLVTDRIEINTFNGWGHTLIKKYYKELGFLAEPEVVDDLLKREIIIDLLEKTPKLPLDYENPFMDLPYAKGCVLEVAGLIDKLKSDNVQNPAEVLQSMKAWKSPDNLWFGKEGIVFNLYQAYNKALFAKNCLDYADQLRLLPTLRGLGIFSELGYLHIIIDEYQDSDPNQIAIIKAVKDDCKDVRSITVVGDIMQSIYSFRNTSPENLLNFGKTFRGARSYDLTTNFRSSEGVISWANRMITRDPDAKGAKLLQASRGNIAEPTLFKYEKEGEAYIQIVEKLNEWAKKGIAYEKMAIIARTKAELINVQKALTIANIPSTIKVPEVVAQNPFVKAMFGLNCFMKEEDMIGFALYAKALGKDPFDFVELDKFREEVEAKFEKQKSAGKKLNLYMTMLEELAEKDFVSKEFFDKIKSQHCHSVAEVVSFIRKYKEYQVKDTTKTDAEGSGVTLITIHSSKGLEYHNVVLMTGKLKETAEEKRLLYVGVTRARDELMIVTKKDQYVLLRLLDISEQNTIKAKVI